MTIICMRDATRRSQDDPVHVQVGPLRDPVVNNLMPGHLLDLNVRRWKTTLERGWKTTKVSRYYRYVVRASLIDYRGEGYGSNQPPSRDYEYLMSMFADKCLVW